MFFRWDEHSEDDFYSEHVKILFYAIYNTINQLGPVASAAQNRDVRSHMIELVSFMCSPDSAVYFVLYSHVQLIYSGYNYCGL
jgi:hypothetical protein